VAFSCYRGSLVQGPWKPGEVRTVPDATAQYLCATFPGNFKRSSGFDASGVLSGTSKAAIAALEGLTSDDLRACLAAEEAGKARKTVIGAIRAALEG